MFLATLFCFLLLQSDLLIADVQAGCESRPRGWWSALSVYGSASIDLWSSECAGVLIHIPRAPFFGNA